MLKIGCIVEGKGDVAAVPVLIRRIAADLYPELAIDIPRPIRVHRYQVIKEGELEREVELAVEKIRGQGAIFIILDSEDDCPAELGPALLDRASQARSDLPIAVVLAKHEFEAWFLAAVTSLRGQRGLKNNTHPPNDPEAIRNAKGWLSQQMESNRTYSETSDQPALTALFDFEQALQTDSFDKCYREIVRLLGELRNRTKV
ncbi:DUF4276 family protein [Candidatus Poribacteria bacterium]|nr:DUF4276 family protein [Candidatus Poribacteria bacterium]MYG05843.1 DUF4276 family protein [Candidatus Poribacteria bacterium]MYK22771.1 DUF4276 family protein [Candidatus Poribacteria bacterium]